MRNSKYLIRCRLRPDHLKSRPSIGQLWATECTSSHYTPTYAAPCFRVGVVRTAFNTQAQSQETAELKKEMEATGKEHSRAGGNVACEIRDGMSNVTRRWLRSVQSRRASFFG